MSPPHTLRARATVSTPTESSRQTVGLAGRRRLEATLTLLWLSLMLNPPIAGEVGPTLMTALASCPARVHRHAHSNSALAWLTGP